MGGHGSVRAITPIDQHGTCSVVSFYDVRSAVAFFDAITKVMLQRRRDGKRMAHHAMDGRRTHHRTLHRRPCVPAVVSSSWAAHMRMSKIEGPMPETVADH